MITYILRRCVQAIPVLFGITLFTFMIAHLVPGDPVQAFAGDKQISPELAAQIRQQYGLDKPLWQQYITYMDDLVHGDMGAGLHNKRPVTDTIREAIGPTLKLTARRPGGRPHYRRHLWRAGGDLSQHLDRFDRDGDRLARRLVTRVLSWPDHALHFLVPSEHVSFERLRRLAQPGASGGDDRHRILCLYRPI